VPRDLVEVVELSSGSFKHFLICGKYTRENCPCDVLFPWRIHVPVRVTV
jgi:hypothetical protein